MPPKGPTKARRAPQDGPRGPRAAQESRKTGHKAATLRVVAPQFLQAHLGCPRGLQNTLNRNVTPPHDAPEKARGAPGASQDGPSPPRRPKRAPGRPQDGAQKGDLNGNFEPSAQTRPQEAPRSPQVAPRGSQEAPREPQEAPKRPPGGPQEAPKRPPRPPQKPPRGPRRLPKCPRERRQVPAMLQYGPAE